MYPPIIVPTARTQHNRQHRYEPPNSFFSNFYKKHKTRIITSLLLFIAIFSLIGLPFTNWWFHGTDDFHSLYMAYKTKTWKELFYFFYEGNILDGWGPSNMPRAERASFFNAYYRPLYCVYFTLQYWLFGTNAYAYFLCNVFFHALNTVILFNIFLWLIPIIPALLTALVFAFHPSIAYKFGDIVNFHFYVNVTLMLFTMLAFKHYLDSKKITFYLLSCTLFTLSLFTRESSIVLPAILLGGTYLYTRARISFDSAQDRLRDAVQGTAPQDDPSRRDKVAPQGERDNVARGEEPAIALALRQSSGLTSAGVSNHSSEKKNQSYFLQACKLTAGFWLILILFFALRLFLYPLKLVPATQPLLSLLKKKLLTNIAVFTAFSYDMFGISWLPWGYKVLRGSVIITLFCILAWLLINNQKKIYVLYFFACAALMLWPAYVGYYPQRYFYEVHPFILMAFILCFKYYQGSLTFLKKIGVPSLCLLTFFYTTLTVESFRRREKKHHALKMATLELVKNPLIKNRALCFLGYPIDGCGFHNAAIYWILLNDPSIPVYFDQVTGLTQGDADTFTITPWCNMISHYYDQNFFSIKKIDHATFRFTSHNFHKAQFLQATYPSMLGKTTILNQEKRNGENIITDFSLTIDEKWLKQNPLFISWDYKDKKFRFL